MVGNWNITFEVGVKTMCMHVCVRMCICPCMLVCAEVRRGTLPSRNRQNNDVKIEMVLFVVHIHK